MPLGLNYSLALLQLATAYKAKLLCSGVFVSKRQPQSLLAEDLAVDSLAPLQYFKATINRKNQTVTTSFLGTNQRRAVYRPGLGTTLAIGKTPTELYDQSTEFSAWYQQNPPKAIPLPTARTPHPEVNQPQLEKAIKAAFSEPNPKKQQRTRAIVIVRKGKIIAERYAKNISSTTPLLGWSMTKSVINALIGILIQQGKLSLDRDNLLPEWRSLEGKTAAAPTDPRSRITLDQLLRMSSGLQFSENYANPLSDATTMLFRRGDKAKYAAQRSPVTSPGSSFYYSSGTTVLLCRIIKAALGSSLTDYFAFPHRALFHPLGMSSAVLEPDAAGTFTGSSFMYATATDWAKLGLLYLQDGCWSVNNKWTRLLPEGWVQYATSPGKTADFYGAHFWRGVPLSFTAENRNQPDWPKDAYLASGYQGQFLTVIPSQELVIVRLGLSQRRNSWNHEQFISQISKAIG